MKNFQVHIVTILFLKRSIYNIQYYRNVYKIKKKRYNVLKFEKKIFRKKLIFCKKKTFEILKNFYTTIQSEFKSNN